MQVDNGYSIHTPKSRRDIRETLAELLFATDAGHGSDRKHPIGASRTLVCN